LGHCLNALKSEQHVIADDWRVLSDLAWQHSLDAYERIERRLEQVRVAA
jgi:hypothetical protein